MAGTSIAIALGLALAGCAAGPEGDRADDSGPASTLVAASDEVVRTRVYLQDGGEPIVLTETISRAEFAAEAAAREALSSGSDAAGDSEIGVERSAIGLDTGCAGSSMWIFDNPGNRPGTFPFNHEICFFSTYTFNCADLHQYNRYCIRAPNGTGSCVPWSSNNGPEVESWVVSFYSGNGIGYFTGLEDGFFYVETPFGTYEREDDAQNVSRINQDTSGVKSAQSLCQYIPQK